MPRLFLFASVFLSLIGAASTFGQTSVVKSVAELSKLGILVERLPHDTPMASVEIGSLVEPEKTPLEYDRTECVVLNVAVDADRLVLADAGSLESVTILRRSESTKQRSIFLVVGKDLPKSYLAFQFNVREGGTTKTVRYLFPISQIPKHFQTKPTAVPAARSPICRSLLARSTCSGPNGTKLEGWIVSAEGQRPAPIPAWGNAPCF